jgi:hypothetical protein
VDDGWGIQRELQGDIATKRVSDDVGLLYAHVRQQPPTVGGLLGDAAGTGGATAAGVAAPVIGDELVAIREAGFAPQRLERISDERAVDADYRLASTGDCILQAGTIDLRSLHGHP